MKVVAELLAGDVFEIRDRGGEFAQVIDAQSATVERVERVTALGDGVVVALACLGVVLVFEVQVRQLFVISGRGILLDDDVHLANPAAAGEDLEGLAQQTDVGQRLDRQVGGGAQWSEKKNDVEPVCVRPAANKMDERQGDQHDAKRRISEAEHTRRK